MKAEGEVREGQGAPVYVALGLSSNWSFER